MRRPLHSFLNSFLLDTPSICGTDRFALSLHPPQGLLFLFLSYTSYYCASASDVKCHEAVLWSVVFTRFSKVLSRIASIRAYGLEDILVHKLMDTIDNMNRAYFLAFANQSWLSVCLDLVGNILIHYRTLTLL